MGSSERWERNLKALEKGKKAYQDRIPIDQCPYKYSEWGLGIWWDMGWREAQQEENDDKKPG